MATKRQTILAKIKTVLEAIVDSNGTKRFPYVTLSKMPPTDLDTAPLPACFVYSNRETRILSGSYAVIGRENWEWYITIEVWAQDKDMEDLLGYIHSAMYTEEDLDHNAELCERMGVDFWTIDPTQQLEAMIIPFRIIYRHSLGVM